MTTAIAVTIAVVLLRKTLFISARDTGKYIGTAPRVLTFTNQGYRPLDTLKIYFILTTWG